MRSAVAQQLSGGTGSVLRDPYGRSVVTLEEDGAAVARSADYLVAVAHDRPEGRYEAGAAGLTWREAAPYSTVRFDVAVADVVDGRFVPGLTIYLSAQRDGRTYAAAQCHFRWHPILHRYAVEMRLVPGRYDLTVRIAAPGFARHDRTAGRRYADPVELRFPDVLVHRTRYAT
jgi:hypothetical protein